MQNQNETEKIKQFLSIVSSIIAGHVRLMFQATGAKVRQHGRGLNMTLSIKSGKKEVSFSLQNLFLEIATIDRDEQPLRFDEKLRDFDFFLDKMLRSACSKTRILFQLLLEQDVDIATEGISQNRERYEGFSVYGSGQNKPSGGYRKYLRLPGVGFLWTFRKNMFRPKETAQF